MPEWRDHRTEEEWGACSEAIAAARAEAARLSEAGPLGFEALNARVGDVIHPLEAFADAAVALRRSGRLR